MTTMTPMTRADTTAGTTITTTATRTDQRAAEPARFAVNRRAPGSYLRSIEKLTPERQLAHSHGLVHDSIKRSKEGVRAVLLSLGVLGLAAAIQTLVFVLSGSVALLADLIHNFGDALTAVPLGIAFIMRSERAEQTAGLFVVAAIFISACVAGVEAVLRLVNPSTPDHLWPLAAAGAVGYVANFIAAKIRTRAGRRLDSSALIADGDHARADAYVSLAVIASAVAIAIGAPIVDPLIGLAITVVILRITWQSWRTVHGHDH
jgi:cation diffusion facilitator family transporter